MLRSAMGSRFSPVRVIAILVGGALTLWVTVGVTLSLTIATRDPMLARTWWPVGVAAKVADGQATLLSFESLSAAAKDRMRGALRDAALREPVNNGAVAALAALDDYRGDKAQARTLFRLSEGLSRRNNMTQLWLIEDAVARNDVSEAIHHYDRAMRVSFNVRPTLLPVLIKATADSTVRSALIPVLSQRPRWWKDYVQLLGQRGENAQAMTEALHATRLDVRKPDERFLAEGVLRRMVALNAERAAVAAANRLDGVAGNTRGLQEGSFEGAAVIAPFAWALRDETSIRAYRDTVPNGTLGLRVLTSAGASGGVAQQLIGLAPGRYTLQGVAGDVSSDVSARAAIELRCGAGQQFARFVLPPAGGQGQRFRFVFDVPAEDCGAQWVGIVTAPAVDTDMWLDNLTITR